MSAALRDALVALVESAERVADLIEPGWMPVGEGVRRSVAGGSPEMTRLEFVEHVHWRVRHVVPRRWDAELAVVLRRLAAVAALLARDGWDSKHLRCLRAACLAQCLGVIGHDRYLFRRGAVHTTHAEPTPLTPLAFGGDLAGELARWDGLAATLLRSDLASVLLRDLLDTIERLAEDVCWWEVTP